jgi:hypothetical protein
MTVGWVAFAVAVVASTTARADDPWFEALGHAPVMGGDRVRARERALDEALRQALEQATATLLTPDQLVARASELKLRVYPRARSYVPTYRVLEEGEQPPGTFEIHLSAQVATQRLFRDLSPQGRPSLPAPPPIRPQAFTCVELKTPPSPTMQPPLDPAVVKAVDALLEAHEVTPVHGGDCTPERTQARGLDAALVASLDLSPESERIRGTDLYASHGRATLRLFQADGRLSRKSRPSA